METLTKPWGISFKDLDKEAKKEILQLDFSFDSFKNYTKNYHLKYQKNCIKIIPEMNICFNDECFIYFCQLFGKAKININNILNNIRDYFILETRKTVFDGYLDEKNFIKIKKDVIDIYPIIKKKYGINKYLDKFLSFFFTNNDYNNEKTKEILDNYDNQNDNYIKLKDKED